MRLILCCIAVLSIEVTHAADYFVSANGDDGSAGTSQNSAWRSIQKVNASRLQPGDSVFFRGGDTFTGNLEFRSGGSAGKPITITSFGDGAATLNPGNGGGIRVVNAAGILISKLRIVGSGRETNGAHGISFFCDLPGDVKLKRVEIADLEVSGFGLSGIDFEASNGHSGFKNVRIVKCSAHDNGESGIRSSGYCPQDFTGWSHADFYVAHCTAFNNPGRPEKKKNHSGSGIVIGGVDGVVIEYCEAYGNGALCNCRSGGPVGIWMWDCRRGVIQFCESHHNRTGKGSLDGGGFDLDGGAVECVIQYNFSHDNDGAGFLLAQYEGARAFSGNVIRYNISQNDGRAHDYGAIHIWSQQAGEVKKSLIHNNTIFVAPSESGNPAAVACTSPVEEIVIANNILVTTGSVPIIRASKSSGLRLAGNVYYNFDGKIEIYWPNAMGERRTFNSLSHWRETSGQEFVAGNESGLQLAPGLIGAGTAKSVGDLSKLKDLREYQLAGDSQLRGTGVDIRRYLGADPGRRDFFGTPLPEGALTSGAFQIPAP